MSIDSSMVFGLFPTSRLSRTKKLATKQEKEWRIFWSLQRNNYPGNQVKTTLLDNYTWLFVTYWWQLKYFLNIYFFTCVGLGFFVDHPNNNWVSLGTLLVITFWVSLKYKWEDLQRARHDAKENRRQALVFSKSENKFVKRYFKLVRVGDIVKVTEGETAPADLVLIGCSMDNGVVLIDTCMLDGETTLKKRHVHPGLQCHFSEYRVVEENLVPFNGRISGIIKKKKYLSWFGKDNKRPKASTDTIITFKVEQPRASISNFSGQFEMGDTKGVLRLENTLFRGTHIRVNWVTGVVMYTGYQTRIMMNAKKGKQKKSSLSCRIDKILQVLFGFVMLLNVYSALRIYFWRIQFKGTVDYLELPDKELDSPFGFLTKKFFFCVIVFMNIIPLSLNMGVEFFRMIVLKQFNKEKKLATEETPATCRNPQLPEELGEINYIFTDKTGTLTQNSMSFVGLYAGGVEYPSHEALENDYEPVHVSDETSESPVHKLSLDPNVYHTFMTGGQVYWCLILLNLCNSVRPKAGSNQDKRYLNREGLYYLGESPDEVAFCEGCAQIGVAIKEKLETECVVSLAIDKTLGSNDYEEARFQILTELEFNADRKKMTVIATPEADAEDPSTSQLMVLTKGADSGVEPCLTEALTEDVREKICKYSKSGLRVMCLAMRVLTLEEYRTYEEMLIAAEEAKDWGASLRDEAYAFIEKDLKFLGLVVLEDCLIPQLNETLNSLRGASMKIWMLTGDNHQTAVDIALSSGLFQEGDEICEVVSSSLCKQAGVPYSAPNFKKPPRAPKPSIIGKFRSRVEREWKASHSNSAIQQMVFEKLEEISRLPQNTRFVLVIDGPTLELILHGNDLAILFAKIMLQAHAGVCSRLAPAQKAQLVMLVRYHRKGIVSLAIGDGANDVPMITEANVGIGIVGKEGTQAERASDFAIPSFSKLPYLLLHFGRQTNRRLSSLILYYVYKNVVLLFCTAIFMHMNGFSGTMAQPELFQLGFNAAFTSFTGLAIFCTDSDISYKESLMRPHLYKMGVSKCYTSTRVCGSYFALAIFHSLVCTFLPVYVMNEWRTLGGHEPGYWYFTVINATCVLLTVTYKIMLEAITLSRWGVQTILFCLLLYLIFAIFLNLHWNAFIILMQQNVFLHSFFYLFTEYPQGLLLILVTPIVALIPDMFLQAFFKIYFPTPLDRAIREITLNRAKDMKLKSNFNASQSASNLGTFSK